MTAPASDSLTTADGLHLAARRWPPVESPRAAVVLVHGFTSSMSDPRLSPVANAVYDARPGGVEVLVYDGRGHGRSDGVCTIGDLERHDVAAAVALARERCRRVVAVGSSLGAVAVLRHAVTDPDLTGVVLVSSPARWELPKTPQGLLSVGLTRTALGRAITQRFLHARLSAQWTWIEPPVALVEQLACPIALIHATRDPLMPARSSRILYEAAREPRRLVLRPRFAHAYGDWCAAPVRDAVDWALQKAA
jgi:alpha-beta hydrolase superfamily lysophospholipase